MTDLFTQPVKPARVFRFLWIGQRGPVVRQFTSIEAFSGYIAETRRILGAHCVEFRNPLLCVGTLP